MERVVPHGDEYAEYLMTGQEIKLQDPYHILLTEKLGLMVTFADKNNFSAGADLLASHLEWGLDYWRKHASKVESATRNDLSGSRSDLRVTAIRLSNNEGRQLKIYLIPLAAKEGVFVLSLSPVDGTNDPQIKEIAASFQAGTSPAGRRRNQQAAHIGSRVIGRYGPAGLPATKPGTHQLMDFPGVSVPPW